VLRMLLAIAFILYGAKQSLRGPFYGLLFYLGLAYFRPETWVWGDQLQSLNLSFLVGLYVVGATVLSSKERIKWNAPVALIVLLCMHGLVSTLLSNHFEWSFFWWRGFAKVTVITILIISLVNTEERFRTTLLVIAFCLGFESVKQGWASLVLRSDQANLNGVEILGDNNGVAVGMLMLTSVLLALFQTSKRVLHKGTFAFMAVGCVARALATFSRGGLLSLGAMTVVYWTRSRHRVAMGLLMAVLAGGLLWTMPQSYWIRMSTITTDQEQMESSSAGRLYFWRTATRMANDHPFFGVGHTGFQAAYDDYDETDGQYGRGRAVHSTWFGMLAEQGYVGLLMLITIIAVAFAASGRARRVTRKRPDLIQTFTFAGAMQAALVTAAVGGTFLSYHYVEILWHFIGLSFAIRLIAERAVAVETPAGAPAQPAIVGSPLAPAYGIRATAR
jgi:putative inorganic carbon (hco3(-)) transporter